MSLLHKYWAFAYKINIFEWKKNDLNEIFKGIEDKNQETLKENRVTECKQTRIEFCYTWKGIIKLGKTILPFDHSFRVYKVNFVTLQL